MIPQIPPADRTARTATRRVDTPTSICRFGIARGDITPPVGIYHRMWGAALHDRAEGVHQPLLATAMVFRPTEQRDSTEQRDRNESLQIVVTLDHCLYGVSEIEALQSAVSKRTGIPASAIVVLFSHTHAAGLMLLDRAELPGGELIAPYLTHVNEIVAGLVAEALQNTVPATITYGCGRCDLAGHRDMWDEQSQQWVCGFHPDGPADDTLVVARVTNAADTILATLVNYACHPTTLAWENRLISPDYPGELRNVMEHVTGAPCVFLQGASGELGPREGYVGAVSVAERNGRQAGYAALSALTALPPPRSSFIYAGPMVSGATLGTWKYEPLDAPARKRAEAWGILAEDLPIAYRAELPTASDVVKQRDHWLAEETSARERGDTERVQECRAQVERGTRMLARLKLLPSGSAYPYQLRVWRMGNAVWIAAQGEPYNALQTELRRRFPEHIVVVCALANGWGPSYIPLAELYGCGLYQESIAVLERDSLNRIITEAANRITKLHQGF